MKPIGLVLVLAVVAAAAGSARATQPQSRPAFALALPPLSSAVRQWFPARHSLCDVRRGPLSYSWPVRPFRSEHPIRAFFGDPRTIFRSADRGDVGSFSFHNGVDIAAPDRTPVYPVFSGVVVKATNDEISVASPPLDRVVQYWHLVREVWVGLRVRAYKTVLGVVQKGRGHVHLTEIDGKIVVNPLEPGHLMPYRKRTIPTVTAVFVRDSHGKALTTQKVSGTITLAATAYDTPPLPLSPPWTAASVTPAIVRWRLAAADGRSVLPVQTPSDFSSTIPLDDYFDSVYGTGTYQNFPTVGGHYYFGARGQYVFNLTASALDTRALAPGGYTLTVSAQDTCGNLGTLTEKLDVARQPGLRPVVGSITPLLPAPQWPHHFWTVVLAQAGSQTQAFRDSVVGRAYEARTGSAAVLITRKGPVYGIAGAFPSWAAAYTEAQRVAHLVPGAYALDVRNPVLPPRLIPMPGKPLPA